VLAVRFPEHDRNTDEGFGWVEWIGYLDADHSGRLWDTCWVGSLVTVVVVRGLKGVTDGGYGHIAQPSEPGAAMVDNALTAVADSVQLHREIEGPGGGPATREQVQWAVDYYAMNYARYTPSFLAAEIHRCRTMVVDMLARDQPERNRTELRRLAKQCLDPNGQPGQ
jgi:hypothetical protein